VGLAAIIFISFTIIIIIFAILFFTFVQKKLYINRSKINKKGGSDFFLFSQEKSSQKSASNEGEGIRTKVQQGQEIKMERISNHTKIFPKSLNQNSMFRLHFYL
jgi:hypothetical protein